VAQENRASLTGEIRCIAIEPDWDVPSPRTSPQRSVFVRHWDGINHSLLARREGIGSATVERWFEDFSRREAAERSDAACPQVLGIDEHVFSRRHGYAPRFLRAVYQLRQARLPQLVQLGETLHSWREEIASMWRFTRNNGITEGFHTKMEVLQRQAYGFRNFNNYRLRVKVMCC